MDVVHFGETQVLVSLFMQLTILFTVMTIVITNIVANTKPDETYEAVIELEKLMLMIAVVAFVIMVLISSFIQTFFHFESILPLYSLALSLLITFPLTISQAYLRGKQHFGSVTLSTILSALAKLILSAVLVYLGWRTFGAITGIVLAQLIALAYTQWRAQRSGFRRQYSQLLGRPNFKLLLPQLKFAAFVAVVSLLITFQFSLDMLVVKRFFNPEIAGLYAGVATVGRIIYFLTASVSAVLLSSLQIEKGSHFNRKLLIQSGLFLLVLGGSALLVFIFFPQLIMKTLMGARYSEVSSLLPGLSAAIFLVSVANLFLTYCIGLRLYQVWVPTLLGAVATYGLLLVRHGSLEQIVQSLLWGSMCLLIFIVGWAIPKGVKSYA